MALAITLDTPEQMLTQYNNLTWQQARKCFGKLPKHTTLEPEDLYQEGVAQLLHAFTVYQKTNFVVTTSARRPAKKRQGAVGSNGKRRASFTSYAQAALMNRFGRIVQQEWRRWGLLIDPNVGVEDEGDEAYADGHRSAACKGLAWTSVPHFADFVMGLYPPQEVMLVINKT